MGAAAAEDLLARGVLAPPTADGWLAAGFWMRMVFFPDLAVGSEDICLTRVWINVFWSISLGQSIMYC